MSKSTARIRLFSLLLAGVFLSGCAQAPAMPKGPMPVATEDYRRTFDAAVACLGEHGFLIDRLDYRFGRITTRPRVAPNALEVWNGDNSTVEQAISASVNNQTRIATIKIDRATGDNVSPQSAYTLAVEVAIERTTYPNRRLTGSSDSQFIVRPLKATPEEFHRQGVHGKSTHFVERDEPFEQKLLAGISAKLAAVAHDEPSPDGR